MAGLIVVLVFYHCSVGFSALLDTNAPTASRIATLGENGAGGESQFPECLGSGRPRGRRASLMNGDFNDEASA